MFIGLLFAVLVTLAVSVVVLVNGFASARQSAYTQAHGVPRAATVTSVIAEGRNPATEDVNVSLTDPSTASKRSPSSFPTRSPSRLARESKSSSTHKTLATPKWPASS